MGSTSTPKAGSSGTHHEPRRKARSDGHGYFDDVARTGAERVGEAMTHTVTISTAQHAASVLASAAEWIKRRVMAGRSVRLSLSEERRTLPQNSLIHPTVAELAKAMDRPTDKESLRKLRYLLLEQWRAETGRMPLFERSIDGLRWVEVSTGTSDLDKPDCSEFIDWMMAQG